MKKLLNELRGRGVKVGVATSVKKEDWEKAMIYPHPKNPDYKLSPEQNKLI
jgi:hypothetical protein